MYGTKRNESFALTYHKINFHADIATVDGIIKEKEDTSFFLFDEADSAEAGAILVGTSLAFLLFLSPSLSLSM